MEPRKWYESKTVWMQLLGLVAVMVPQSQEILKEYFAEAGSAWVAINLLLRFISSGKVQIL